MKIFVILPFILTIFFYNSICGLENCVKNLFGKLFLNENTIHFISENFEKIPLQLLNNSAIIANIHHPIKLSGKFQGPYVLYIQGQVDLKETLKKLRENSIWNNHESSRGKFLIVTSSRNLKNIFEVLWSNDIINVIVIRNGTRFPEIYVSDPFAKENFCGNEAKFIFSQPCDKNTIGYNKTIKDLNGCLLKVSNVVMTTRFKESPPIGLLWAVIFLVGEVLNTKNVTGTEMKNQDAAHLNPSEGILVSFRLTREEKDLVKFEFSEIYYYDKLVWAVPKPNKIFGVRITFIYTTTVWISILTTFLLEVIAWWVIAKYDNDSGNFQEFSRSFLANYAFLFSQANNLTPTKRALKSLALFFMLYCIVISVSSQANLMSGLTNPSYEHGITTLEELAESDLKLLTTAHSVELISDRVALGYYPKLEDKLLVPKQVNHTENLARLVQFRNFSILLAYKSIQICLPHDSTVNVLDGHLLDVEITLAMRKGHFFLPTLNKLLKRLNEHGFSEKFMGDAKNADFVPSNSVHALKISHLYEPFVCLGVGLLFALLVFILELIRKKANQ